MTTHKTNEQNDTLAYASLLVHDLETPLAVAKHFLARVQQGRFDPDNPRHQKVLEGTVQAISRAERILEDTLDQARNGPGGLSLNFQESNLAGLIDSCLHIVTPLADEAGVTLQHNSESTLPQQLRLDAQLITRVIDNFLVNAIRHATPGSTIEVRSGSDSEMARVEVHNQTDQDLQDVLPQVFEPDSQVALRRQRRVRGSGLGLSFSRMIVEAHDGLIGAQQDVNRNVIFWFQLPL